MPAHRVTYEFEATVGVTATSGSKAGWSESWYDARDSTDEAALAKALALKNARRLLLTPGWSMTGVRVSRLDDANNLIRRGLFAFIPPANGVGQYPGDNMDEQPYDAIIIHVVADSGSQRAFLMRGIGQNVVNAGARYLAPPAFVAAFGTWFQVLSGTVPGTFGDDFALRIRTNGPKGQVLNVQTLIAALPQATRITPYVVLSSVVGLVAGQTITIGRVEGLTGINGSWVIDEVFAIAPAGVQPGVLLKPKRNLTVGGVFISPGVFSTFSYLLTDVRLATPGFGASRRTGRPTQVTRGRRSNRK